MLKRFPAYGRPRHETPPLSESLRYLIVGRMHAGLLQPGERLPSIRELASRSQVDHRVAAAAYRQLELEGLVEVRRKAGVFVTSSLGESSGAAEAVWAADVLYRGWRSGISRSSLCNLFGGTIASPLRCGCVESNEDHMAAMSGEIGDALSLETVPIYLSPAAGRHAPTAEEIAEVDVVVTSVFHAARVREVARAAGKPLAVLTLHRDFSAAIARRLLEGVATVVIADPRYAEIGREFLTSMRYAPHVRFLTVEEAAREEIDPSDDSVLLTRAARKRLRLEEFHLVRTPLVSDESARALCEAVAVATPRRRARLRLEAPRGSAEPLRLPASTRSPAPREPDLDLLRSDVGRALREDGLFAALRLLNGTTRHRFTGVYRYDGAWVRSHALFDRENPWLPIGPDVPLREAYCAIIAETGEHFQVEDAAADPRLATHPSRERILCYCGVPLLDPAGEPWGALCHYDFRPGEVPAETLRALEAVRLLVEESLLAPGGTSAGGYRSPGTTAPSTSILRAQTG